MDLAIAQELGLLKTGDQAQDALLFPVPQVILESDNVVTVGARVLLAQLYHRPGTPSGAWIHQAHRLQRTEAQGFAAAPDEFLHRQAGFKERNVLGDLGREGLGLQQRVDEALVLFL